MQLHVLPLQWPNLRFVYTMPEAWSVLARTDLARALLVLDESDIQAYDWAHQEIWLSESALDRMHRTRTADLLQDSLGRAFVVTLEGERLYGGLFYMEGAPPAIQFPVIHAVGPENRVLRIRPALCCGWNPDEPRLADQTAAIGDPRIAEWLRSRHLLTDHPPDERPPDPWAKRF